MNATFTLHDVAYNVASRVAAKLKMPQFKRVIALLCIGLMIAPVSQAQYVTPPAGKTQAIVPAYTAPSATAPAGAQSRDPQLVDAILVVVNNEVITRKELIDRMLTIESRMTAQGVALPPRNQLQSQVLERMIVERAQVQQAKEDGIKVDDAMLDTAMERIADQNKLSLSQFRSQLERSGMPYPAFREQIRNEIMMQRVREREVDTKIQISDSEIDNYLAAEASSGTQSQEVDVAQILIRLPENPTPDQLLQRRKRAEEAYQQVRTGGDFAKIAATYSDSSDAMSGGDLGWRAPDRLPQLFADAIANLKPGEMAPIMRSNNGFHILRLVDRRIVAGTAATAAVPITQTHARHILIKVSQVVTAAEARRKLVELKQRLDNNAATFEELAKLYSNDLSASKGGDLGWIYPADTVPEFEKAMNALAVGQVSDPVESPFGFHLIQVLERKSDDMSLERQRTAARAAIRERKVEEATEEWMRQLRDRAYVEYRLDQN
jgi:peptidyl-prolyl cis-trans isomerase SurA